MLLFLALTMTADVPTFKVTNKCPATFAVVNKMPAKPVAKVRYPIRISDRWWTGCKDWTHMTQGEHAGKFPADWLQSLTWEELQSLHSDNHEGVTKWEYVPKTLATTAPATPTYFPTPTSSTCPGGNCPQQNQQTYRPGLLGRILGR